MTLLALAKEQKNFQKINTACWRIVEQQSQSAIRVLVSDVDKLEILEGILHENKPPVKLNISENHCRDLHYLLLTPFRYPPLKHGSRFGTRFERGIFYGSLELSTAMQETAYYRLAFALGTAGKIGGRHIPYTAFKAKIITNSGIDLTQGDFQCYKTQISSPVTYQYSQPLANVIRDLKIEAFFSYSARAQDDAVNINILTPSVFLENKKLEQTFRALTCFYTKDVVEFYSNTQKILKVIKLTDFLVDEKFPFPPI